VRYVIVVWLAEPEPPLELEPQPAKTAAAAAAVAAIVMSLALREPADVATMVLLMLESHDVITS
jgi:hypothetical protein